MFIWQASNGEADGLQPVAKEIDLASRCVELAFHGPSSKATYEAWMVQLNFLRDLCALAKSAERFVKVGRNAEACVRNDVKNGLLFGYLKQLEGMQGKLTRMKEASQAETVMPCPSLVVHREPWLVCQP